MKKPYALIAAALLVATAFGCSDDEETRPTFGMVTVRMTDAPAQYDEVNIVVTGVQVLRGTNEQSGTWETVSTETHTYDLLDLRNGVLVTLGQDNVPAERYTQVRLLIGAGSNVVVDGVTHPLVIPSGMQSGLKLLTHFDVPAGGNVDIVLDFDAARSIHQTGSGTYILNPVIRVLVNAEATTGRISGDLDPAVDATVHAIQGTDTLTTAIPSSTGQFMLYGLAAGNYSVAVDVDAGAGYRDTTLVGVAVQSGQTTQIGPITLTAE